jgi:hypothetical protein
MASQSNWRTTPRPSSCTSPITISAAAMTLYGPRQPARLASQIASGRWLFDRCGAAIGGYAHVVPHGEWDRVDSLLETGKIEESPSMNGISRSNQCEDLPNARPQLFCLFVKWITQAAYRLRQGKVCRMAQANLISGADKAVGVDTPPTALFFHSQQKSLSSRSGRLRQWGGFDIRFPAGREFVRGGC